MASAGYLKGAVVNSIKPIVEHATILALLQETFPAPIEDLTPLEGGQVALVFSSTAGSRACIPRLNPDSFDVNEASANERH